MIELLLILFAAFCLIGFFKIFALIFEAGFFVAVLPLKIIGAVFGLIAALICIPLILVPLVISLFIPVLLIGLGVMGLVYLLR